LDLKWAGFVHPKGRIIVVAPLEIFRAGASDLVAKLKTFRYEDERRLGAVADYARSEECRSVFLRRYFGEGHPPRCGTCDRCRAIRAAATRAGPFWNSEPHPRSAIDQPTMRRLKASSTTAR
jgi:RecQ helicase-like protein